MLDPILAPGTKPWRHPDLASSAALTVLRDRNVRWYVASRFISSLAMLLVRSSLQWQIFDQTGSAFHLGLIGAVASCFIQRHRDEAFKFGATKRFAFCNFSHDKLPPPDRGLTAGGTLAGGRYKAQQKRKETRTPGAAKTR